MHFIIGTAGHVDHGKTTLIRALTGIETDRLREEKERGLSIVPGFAHLTLPGGRVVGIVDVPGHERFLKNMLTGASGVDVAILIVAADEGVMPQTIEHLRVLELLRVQRGVVALTKTDTVEAEWLMLAREDLQAQLEGTLFADAPLVEVSAVSGQGLDELKQVLATLCDAIEAAPSAALAAFPAPFRLAVDRAFSVSGFGTVVTGSAAAGVLQVGDSVAVWAPGAAEPQTARVRGLEVHGADVARVERGQRAAINLAGVDLDEATRGGTVAAPGTLRATNALEAWLRVLPDAPRAVKDDASLRLHLGTTEAGARLLLYEGARLRPGENGYGRLRLEVPLPVARGDRFVLREIATERVLGGGLVLDTMKRPRAARETELPALRAALEAGDVAALALSLLQRQAAGLSEEQLRFELRRLDVTELLDDLRRDDRVWSGGGVLLHAPAAATLQEQVTATLRAYHKAQPLHETAPREVLLGALEAEITPPVLEALLAEMATRGQIVVSSSGARLAGHTTQLSGETARLRDQLEARAHAAAWQPPTLDELVNACDDPKTARDLAYALLKSGTLVRIGDFVMAPARIEEGAARLREHLRRNGTLSVGQARELLDSTRKWIVPLLEYYDKIGLTRRQGEARVLRGG